MSYGTDRRSGRFTDEEKTAPKGANKRRVILTVLIAVFAAIFIVSGVMVARYFIIAQKEQSTFDEIAAMVGQDTDDNSGAGEDDAATGKNYEVLYSQNPDFFGWLKISGTAVNYPVMYTPNDSEYYLHRDFYGDYSESGTPFIDGSCDPNGSYLLIYGHHMNSGAMFGVLPNYADTDFYRSHSKIRFDTREEYGVYTVFAAFYSKVYAEDDTEHFQYYNYKNLSDSSVFDEYISGVKALSVYDTGITPVYGDKIIVLSTCNYHTEDGRFVVAAVKQQ